jgi:hypothetical protein
MTGDAYLRCTWLPEYAPCPDRAKPCILAVIENTRLPSLLPYLTESILHSVPPTKLARISSKTYQGRCQENRENVLQDYKALIPDRVERFALNVFPHDDVSYFSSSFVALSPVFKKDSAVQCTTALWSTFKLRSRGCPTTGRVTPVGFLQKISSGTHSER